MPFVYRSATRHSRCPVFFPFGRIHAVSHPCLDGSGSLAKHDPMQVARCVASFIPRSPPTLRLIEETPAPRGSGSSINHLSKKSGWLRAPVGTPPFRPQSRAELNANRQTCPRCGVSICALDFDFHNSREQWSYYEILRHRSTQFRRFCGLFNR